MTMSDCIIPNLKPANQGYAMKKIDGRYQGLHRISWQILNGPIPKGTVIDHTCHNEDADCKGGNSCNHRMCVNPTHLKAVSHLENVQAGKRPLGNNTYCVNGHVMSDNLAHRPSGKAYCVSCRVESNKASASRRKERG